MAFESKKSVSY